MGRTEPTAAVLVIQALVVSVIAVAIGSHALGGAKPLDFAVLWAAQHVAHPYDSAALTAAMHSPKPTVFPYPPTFLLLTLPLKLASLKASYFAWISVSGSAFVTCVRRQLAPVMIFVPAVFIAGIIGQTTLLIGAALYIAAILEKRPYFAGLLLGLVACCKPQVGVLIPVALIAGGEWRKIFTAAATVAVVSLLATLTFGLHAWGDWLASLPAYLAGQQVQFADRFLSVPTPWSWLVLALGAVVVWCAARRGRTETAYLLALAFALLGSVHAMDYDAAVLVPFVFVAALRWRWLFSPAYVLFAALPPTWLTVAGLAGIACLDLLSDGETATQPARSPRDSAQSRS